MFVRRLWALAALLSLVTGARASDPVAVYALIERVEMEPSTGEPERIRLSGVFEVARPNDRDAYMPTERGHLYFKLGPKNPAQAKKEWNDLKKMAGTGQPVAFGSRHEGMITLRKGADPTKDPDTYPLGIGLYKLPTDEWHGRRLRSFPSVAGPMEAEEVAAGSVTLKVKNGAVSPDDAKATYVFEIEDAKGKKERSKPIAEGNKETTWVPEMKIEAGQKYTWRAWCVIGTAEDKSHVSTATFRGK